MLSQLVAETVIALQRATNNRKVLGQEVSEREVVERWDELAFGKIAPKITIPHGSTVRGICRLMRSNIVSVLKQIGLRLDNYFNRVVLAFPTVLFRPQKRKPDRPVPIRHPNIHEINIKRRCL